MARIEQFENIEAWRNARQLTRQIFAVTNEGLFSCDLGLHDQICWASVSVMSDIAEGYERSSNQLFIHFLNIIKGSAGEVRVQLHVAIAREFIDQERFQSLSNIVQRNFRQLSGFIMYPQASENKGAKR